MKIFVFALLFPFLLFGQSDDGDGNVAIVPPVSLSETDLIKKHNVRTIFDQDNKIRKGKPVRLYEWFNYKTDTVYRFQREFEKDYYFNDEHLALISRRDALYPYLIEHRGKKLTFREEPLRFKVFVYHGSTKVYDTNGLLQATIYFDRGRPEKIHINHYYMNGQLQFVREITSEGPGKPFRNTGVLEAYYPDGTVFENPITEDGDAIVILNEEGEPEDECACMGQNIMEWGEGYLYAFIDKYYYLLEDIYGKEGMDCCWE